MTSQLPVITVKSKRIKSVLNRHPLLYSGSVDSISGKPEPGDWVAVADPGGNILAQGFYNPASAIRVRLLDFSQNPLSDQQVTDLITSRVEAAATYRATLFDREQTDAFRLINDAGDGLPGLIVDDYAGHLVLQPLGFWVEKRLDSLLSAMETSCRKYLDFQSISLRVESDTRRLEGLKLQSGLAAGACDSYPVVEVRELGLSYDVDLAEGQKTGLFLDQRENRRLIRQLHPQRVLNLFCHVGGFSLNALASGAEEALSIDSSAPALAMAEKNAKQNNINGLKTRKADVKSLLPELESAGERFDCVVCDPPPFARKAPQVRQAARAYKDINRRCMRLIDTGWLMTFSCSPFVDARLFRQILFSAAVEAEREVQVIQVLGAGADHPVSLYHPEGDYLNGLLLRVTGGK